MTERELKTAMRAVVGIYTRAIDKLEAVGFPDAANTMRVALAEGVAKAQVHLDAVRRARAELN